MNLRCSSLPVAFQCPGSVRPAEDEILIKIANEAGPLGSAVHEVMAALVLSHNGDGPDVRAVAMKHGVDSGDLARLVAYGLHAWKALAQYYPDPSTEQEMSYVTPTFTLTGHMDLHATGEEWANFLDWKSGYKQPDYFHQLMGYACLLFVLYPRITTVRATVVWLRDWTQETMLVTREDVGQWEESLNERVVRWDGTYTAGAHCQFCPRFAACPARQALVRSALTDIQATDDLFQGADGTIHPSAMPAIVSMYREGKLSVVKGLLKQIDDMILAAIAATGPIDLGNGRELALVPENRDTIEPLTAWPIISDRLSNEELAPCIKIGKTALLDAVGDKAPRGQKAKVKAHLMEELKAAGAVNTTEIKKLWERKIEKEVSHASA